MNFSINHKIFDYIANSPDFFSKNGVSFMSRGSNLFSLGFIIPKSLGSALLRNRFKRRCRSVFQRFNENNVLPLCGVVIKPKTIKMKYFEINQSIVSWVSSIK